MFIQKKNKTNKLRKEKVSTLIKKPYIYVSVG